MKPNATFINPHFCQASRRRGRDRNRALATALMTALAATATPLAHATQLTWSGAGGNGNWGTGGNWAGTAPVNNDSLIFSGPANLVTNNDIAGLTLIAGTSPASAIAFTNTSNVTGGAFTLGGNAITVGGNITTTAVTSGTLVDTISLQLNLLTGRTITTATSHGLTISGLINDTSGANSAGITKGGVATLLLSNDANNFTTLNIQQGTLSATSIANSGSVSAIGRGSTITLGNASTEGVFNFTGANAAMASTNRAISLADSTVGARINNNGSVALLFNGNFTAAGNSSRVLTFGGTNTSANEFQNTLINPGTGALTVTKLDAGTWTLSGPNTYTGNTNINNGTLNVATIADSGSSNLGIGTVIRIGNTSTTGVLNYTGSGSTTSRTVNIGNNSGTPVAGDSGGATIQSNGSGALVFTAANFNTTNLTGSVATARTLTLGGANNGANEIQGVIADGLSGTMKTNLDKSGNGTWILSGANTYTGTTIINAGTLKLGASNVLPNTAVTLGATGSPTTSTLDLNGFSETIGSLSLGRTGTTVGGAMANVANTGGGSPVLTLGGALTYNAGSASFLNGQATISANVDTGGVGRTIAVGDGSAAVDLVISGAISGAGNLTKTGNGVLQLSGANSNTGTLIIQDSMVKLGASNVLTDTTSINLGNTASAAGVTFDLNGFSDTVLGVVLSNASPAAAGFSNSIISTGGTGMLTLGGNLTYSAGGANLNGQATISANIDTGGVGRTIAVGDGSAAVDLVMSGAISGGGNLTKTGNGVLQLSGANSNTGTLIIQDSTVKLGASNVLTDTTSINVGNASSVAGSTFDLNGFSDTVSGVTLGNSTTTLGGLTHSVISSGGGGVLTLSSTLTYNAGSAGFLNGQATISAGLATGAAGRSFAVGNGSAADDLVITGALQAGGGFNLNGGGTMRLDNSDNNHAGSGVSGGSTLKLGANSVLGTGAVTLNQVAAGTATLDLNGKTDAVGAALGLSNASTTALGAVNQIIDSAGGGVLQLNGAVTYNAGAVGFNNGTTTISASLDLNGTTRDFNINDSDQVAQDVIISGVIRNSTGTAGINKNNFGRLVLSGANTYTGDTSVTAGSLAVNGSLANTSTTVGSGGSLEGSGSIGGSVTVLSGGIIAAGNSVESLTTGALTLEAGSTFAYEINNDAAADFAGDLTAVTGNLTLDLGNAALLTLGELGSGSWGMGDKLTLISYSGTWNGGLFSFGSTVADDSIINFSGMDWLFNYNDTSAGANYISDLAGSSFVTMMAVPEPNGAGGVGALITLALLLRRRNGQGIPDA